MHILLTEDNDLNREIAQCILEEAGAEVVTAVDGRKAVDAFQDSPEGCCRYTDHRYNGECFYGRQKEVDRCRNERTSDKAAR